MRTVRKMLLCVATTTALVGIAACGGEASSTTGDAAAISDSLQSLADTVTAPGVAMTSTEFVSQFCKLMDERMTQNQVAEQLALAVATYEVTGATYEATDANDQEAITREAENAESNALAFIAQVPTCQEHPAS